MADREPSRRTRRRARRSTTALLCIAFLVVPAAPAAAHAALMPADTEPGEPLEAELVLAHGCGPEGAVPGDEDEVSPIVSVTLEVPDGVAVEPRDADGWSAATDVEDGRLIVRWDSDDPGGELFGLRLPLVVTADDGLDGTRVRLPVVQHCADGESMAWTEEGGLAEVTYPAASLTVGDPDAGFLADGLPTWAIVGLAVLAALAAGVLVVVLTGRGVDPDDAA